VNPICIYHGNCADGFGAAWAVRKALPDCDFHAGIYQNAPPDVAKRDVILVDFSYKRDVLREMAKTARSILILDHHKSAADDLPGEIFRKDGRCTGNGEPWIIRMDEWGGGPLTWDRHKFNVALDESEGATCAQVYALFDMERSGAGIAWDFFHPETKRPKLIDHIEDRDIWRFALFGTREIQANVFSYPYDFSVWDRLMGMDPMELAKEGAAIERKHHKDVAELVAAFKRRMSIGGVEVWAANIPYTLTSDAGHLMCEGGEPFAACYWDTPEGRVFSLRSREDGADVAEIAKTYGGGGHKHASGFRLPHGVDPHVCWSERMGVMRT